MGTLTRMKVEAAFGSVCIKAICHTESTETMLR
jgi:hypothetical protein